MNLSGKHFHSSPLRVAVCGRAPTQHQRTVQSCCANFRINAGIALHSPNGPALPAFTREQQLTPSKGPSPAPGLHGVPSIENASPPPTLCKLGVTLLIGSFQACLQNCSLLVFIYLFIFRIYFILLEKRVELLALWQGVLREPKAWTFETFMCYV